MATRTSKLLTVFEKQIPKHYGTNVIRQSQVQMALEIARFLHPQNPNRLLIMEAPVGTGKSLGALVPALIERDIRKKRVLYATSTINLQGQLMDKEVPLVESLKLVKTTLLAKGKNHYYCRVEFEKNKGRFIKHSEALQDFYDSSQTGHRDEFEGKYYALEKQEWKSLALQKSMSECRRCKYSRHCPTLAHRSKFLSVENELVITNQDQLIRSVLRVMDEFQPIVPINPGILIIDEAHDFLENFLGQLKDTITINKLFSQKREVDPRYQSTYTKKVIHLKSLLTKEASLLNSFQGRVPLTIDIRKVLKEIEDILSESLYDDDLFYGFSDDEPTEFENTIMVLRRLLSEEYESWVEVDGEIVLASISRFFPSEFRKLIEQLTEYNKVIVMSGTLSVKGDFTSILEQWRLQNIATVTISLPTPFDYSKQALIYVPSDLVAHSHTDNPDYLDNQLDHIQSLIKTTDGRSLILTTSKSHMLALNERLSPFLENKQIKLFLQDNASVEQLTKKFQEDERSVLIGSGSFFSGFSVPGSPLISVIVTKLPFPVPSDPYIKLIGEGLEDDWNQVLIPHMMIKLKQAVGRLIRDISDYGVVTILDPRVFTSDHYGQLIRDTFEEVGYKFTRSREEVESFYTRWNNYVGESIASYAVYKREQLLIDPILDEQIPSKTKPKPVKVIEIKDPETIITENQWEFFKAVRSDRGLSTNKLRGVKTPFELYKHLYALYYERGDSTEYVEQQFPYVSDKQKIDFSWFKGQGLTKTVRWSQEEIEMHLSKLNRR